MKRQCFGCGFKYGNVVAGTADAPQQRPSGRVPVKDFNVFTFASSIWIKPANGTHLWLKSRQRRGFHREADFSHWHYQAVVILYSCRRLQDPPFAHTPPPTSDRTALVWKRLRERNEALSPAAHAKPGGKGGLEPRAPSLLPTFISPVLSAHLFNCWA